MGSIIVQEGSKMKSCKWICVILVLFLISAASIPALAAQDHDWKTYNLPAGVQPAAVVTIGSLVYVGTNDGLYKGIGNSWTKVDTGSVSLGLVRGLAYDAVEQRMYVSDPDHTRVLVWNMADNTWGRFTTRNFDSRGLDLYRNEDNYYVYVTDRAGNYVFELRGLGGYGNIETDATPVGAMHLPYDTVRHGDTLYVADRANNRILMRDADYDWSEIVHSTYTQGVTDLEVLSDGTLYFTEYDKDRVMKYADGHYTIVMAGSALINGPWGIYADEWDNLFICDRLNGRILRSKDDNDRLAGISIDGEPLSGFSPSTTEYTLACDYRTESIDLDAWAESPYAHVSGTGTKTLVVGENHFTVRIDPEAGLHEDYDIYITRPAPPNPAFTAALTADKDTVEVGETVTFTLTLVNTGDVGFTDVDCVNTVSTEHGIADLMMGMGDTITEEIAVTAQESDAGGEIRLAYEVIGRTAMDHEIHVSTALCSVAVASPTPEPSPTGGDDAEPSASSDTTPGPSAALAAEGSPDTSPETSPEAVPAVETGGVSSLLLLTVGGILLLLLGAVIALLILLARQKKNAPGKLPPGGPAPPPKTPPAQKPAPTSGKAESGIPETGASGTDTPRIEEADTDVPETEETKDASDEKEE
jgi:uncharacterized repeat protein (TIGR01451 family)